MADAIPGESCTAQETDSIGNKSHLCYFREGAERNNNSLLKLLS